MVLDGLAADSHRSWSRHRPIHAGMLALGHILPKSDQRLTINNRDTAVFLLLSFDVP